MTSDPASVSRVTSVVEGHGEVAALPILLRRVAAERGYYPQINPDRSRGSGVGGA